MGYTHYWQQKRDFTKAEWAEITAAARDIVADVQNVQGIPLADWGGDGGTQPLIDDDEISLNGLGDHSCETFRIDRKRPPKKSYQTPKERGGGFCKTNRYDYDVAVTAILCVVEAIAEGALGVDSDGNGHDWLPGVQLARRVAPRYANVLDIPLAVRQGDRWTYLFSTSFYCSGYYFRACIDGHAYAFHDKGSSYRFDTHEEAIVFYNKYKHILSPSGWIDKARMRSLAAKQRNLLKNLIMAAPSLGRDVKPPAFARPAALPKVEREHLSKAETFVIENYA